MENVVVTGFGVVSCLGNDPESLFAGLLAGKSGISNIDRFDTSSYSVHFGGEVKNFDHTPFFSDRDASRTSRNIQYAVHAAIQSLKVANLAKDAVDPSRAGVVVGSGIGGMETFHDNTIALNTKGPRRVSPFFIPMAIPNMAAGEVSIQLGWMGPNFSISSACATANHCIMTAADMIRLGRADVMIAGGTEEAVCQTSLSGFASMKALSTRNDQPNAASRPFDKDRDGFVLGEGAGILLLESEKHAKARGAKILATLVGYGATGDAYHMSAPREDGLGVKTAMRLALEMGGLTPSDIKYVNTHGTSTPLGDVAEAKAVQSIFGVDGVKINSTKSMIGHPLGAASGIEAIVTVQSLIHQKIHQTINLENQDEQIELDCCAKGSVDLNFKYGMSNSFGFGGHNSSLIFGL
jgi:3-oxoacyl-[acyl-carrier-protein] synthase II